jgi:hypothetical protein
MVKQGVRNLTILSRNGKNHPLAEKLSADLEEAGCTAVMPTCDIKNKAGQGSH